MDVALFKFIIGIIGNVATLSTGLAPIPTFWKIYKDGSTGNFSSLPYAISFLYNLLWTWYALPFVTKHNLLVLTISATIVALQSFYLTIFIIYSPRKQKIKVVAWIAAMLIGFGVHAMITILVPTHRIRVIISGSAATLASMAAFAAPLSVMRLVIRTKSVEYMPLLLSLSIFFNCATWTIYGVLGRDMFITVAEVVGTALATAQLALYALYYNKTPQIKSINMSGETLPKIIPLETLRTNDFQKVVNEV